MNKDNVVATLNELLEHELAGVVKYTHYSLMVFGPNRIPIVDWLRAQSKESLAHAEEVGELITALDEHPSLKIKSLAETHKHTTEDVLKESIEHEEEALRLYKVLHDQTKDHHIVLEEFARKMICQEETHAYEMKKMLRTQA